MSGASHAPPGAGHGWDEYWRLTRESAAHRAGGPQDAVLSRFWRDLFARTFRQVREPRLLDVGCGSGALVAIAQAEALAAGSGSFVVGLDESAAGLRELRQRVSAAACVRSNAARMPFRDRAFDVVASQFGVEYAGQEAIEECARLTASGGILALVLHMKGGGMYRENAANLDAAERLRSSGLLGAFRDLVRLDEGVARGKASRPALRAAQATYDEAFGVVERLLRENGTGLAGGFVYRLYQDIGDMRRRLRAFDAAEVARWTELMTAEVQAYAGRMSSMLKAALDEAAVEQVSRGIAEQGLALRVREALLMGPRNEPAAWALLAQRE